ncbi:SsrA-binding protein [Spiribacter salinus M19-40]|uniref:SsrA-binding protein n=2 Tax=Spiribacter salinus TaxID=1335746 RepID=R4VKH1_9GAMM|nr:SsrA-binding protein SmpB [Spiribacter salinus]MDR9413898.1 SsrA-binding protein SmpB [Spiribacter sp.]AGM41012.1 SsrA-binding protein [Spiribacter salinus M19-40]MBY5268242.1 SsrA-binding protein [Spiribacter salinus]MDR9454937.1 SsrA-binding protein SmpB [Spiribacter sp.]TQE99399.1 MAG: SsrA-binding protein SmpB [Spiribacter salinus]
MSKKAGKKKHTGDSASIAINRKARFEFFVEERFEAGLVLHGWEVKSLRAGRINLSEAYVILRNGEAYIIGCSIPPLPTASTHVNPDPTRTRKLLLHQSELAKLVGATEQRGYTIVPLDLHWSRGKAKLSIGLAKGKKQHDKRADKKERDWQRERARIMKHEV